MIKRKHIFLLLVILISMLCISAVSAAEDASGEIISADNDLAMDESINDNALSSNDDELILDDNNGDGLVWSENAETALAEGETTTGSFTDLYNDIQGKTEVTLYRNYKFNGTDVDDSAYKNGITIEGAVIIDGNGHTIDGNHNARIFNANNDAVFININFINGNTGGDGGAINKGNAYYCNFTGNSAFYGGAIRSGTAYNCSFTSNSAFYGGAVYSGTTYNSNFTSNNATMGGAMYDGTAYYCNFTSNTATFDGGAMYRGTSVLSTFKDNVCEGTTFVPLFDISEFITTANSGEKLFFNLTYNGEVFTGLNTTMKVYNDSSEIFTASFDGEKDGYAINLPVGVYNAKLTLVSYPEVTCEIKIIIPDGSTFFDLNRTINNDTDAVISLDGDYKFNSTVDSAFVNGIVIDRNVTIEGNGHTIDGNNSARIFYANENATFKNINFINGYSREKGGAIYGGTANYCNFTENFAANGGAIFNGTANNCIFTGNTIILDGYDGSAGGAMLYGTADYCIFTGNYATFGGAIFGGSANYCNFTGNTARVGGAIYGGTANYCNFTGNIAYSLGGAMYYGTAYNCSFTGNTASEGGAMDGGTAYNCSFTGNTASEGGAMNRGTAVLCTYENNDCFRTIFAPFFNISEFITSANSGEKIFFNLTYEDAIYTGLNTTMKVYNDSSEIFVASFDGDTDGFAIDLPAGIYKANLTLADYPVITRVITLYITAPTTISAPDFTTEYGKEDYFVVTLADIDTKPIIGAEITVYLNGKTITNHTDGNGQMKIPTQGLDIDTYDVEINYAGNKTYNVSSATAKITVTKINTSITPAVESINLFVGNDYKVEYTLSPDGAVGEISFTSNDTKVATVDFTGAIKAIGEGTATITIDFLGSTNYKASSATVNVVVNRKSTQITTDDVSTTYNVNKDLVITLKNADGNPIRGVTVSVDLDGAKNYTTDSDGQVKVAVGKLVPKTYTALISFAGDDSYVESNSTAQVTVKKASPTITANAKSFKFEDKTKKYIVALKDNKGNVLKNKKISLKVNGKTYTATTNSKGVATFKLSKLTKKGKYNAVITYAGDKYYNKVTKKAKITVKAPAWKTVAKGSKDKAMVKKIQRALKNNGYYLSYKGRYLKVDGIYDKYTVMAVKQFQKDKKLKVTGKVDYATAKKLKLI